MPDLRPAFGIDFSGAVDAGRKIWLAAGHLTGGTLTISSVRRAADLPGGSIDRAAALAALCAQLIAAAPNTVIGCDFPFSLPHSVIPYPTWTDFLARFTDDYPSPAVLYEAGRGIKDRRETDRLARTPFSPHNLRLYRQTWHGIAQVVRPLVLGGYAHASPMQQHDPHRPALIEVCPASTLKRLGLYHSYKGRGPMLTAARRSLIDVLAGLHVHLPDALHTILIEDTEGDALDAVLAAYAAAHADLTPSASALAGMAHLEGWVYC